MTNSSHTDLQRTIDHQIETYRHIEEMALSVLRMLVATAGVIITAIYLTVIAGDIPFFDSSQLATPNETVASLDSILIVAGEVVSAAIISLLALFGLFGILVGSHFVTVRTLTETYSILDQRDLYSSPAGARLDDQLLTYQEIISKNDQMLLELQNHWEKSRKSLGYGVFGLFLGISSLLTVLSGNGFIALLLFLSIALLLVGFFRERYSEIPLSYLLASNKQMDMAILLLGVLTVIMFPQRFSSNILVDIIVPLLWMFMLLAILIISFKLSVKDQLPILIRNFTILLFGFIGAMLLAIAATISPASESILFFVFLGITTIGIFVVVIQLVAIFSKLAIKTIKEDISWISYN